MRRGDEGGGDEGEGEHMLSIKRTTGDASDGRVSGLVLLPIAKSGPRCTFFILFSNEHPFQT